MKRVLLGAAILGVAYALSDKNTRDKMVHFAKDWSDKLQGFVKNNVTDSLNKTAKAANNVIGYKRKMNEPFASY